MRKLSFCLIFCFLAAISGHCQSNNISLLTCSEGTELYSSFWHSALLVKTTEEDQGWVYSFGAFDFNTPHFYYKFFKGDLDYFLDVTPFSSFVEEYLSENRNIYIQDLQLTNEQEDRIIESLNYYQRPENSTYVYRFSTKNCASILRDILLSATSNPYNDSILSAETDLTVRKLINSDLDNHPWAKMGTNLVLGSKTDDKLSVYESMFLPQELENGIGALHNQGNSLVSERSEISAGNSASPSVWYKYYPLLIAIAFCCWVILANSRFLDGFLLFLTGILGCLILFLSFYSLHPELSMNYNLLWCNPIAVILSILIMLRKKNKVIALLQIACILAMTFIWSFQEQGLQPSFVLLCVTQLIVIVRRFLIAQKQALLFR